MNEEITIHPDITVTSVGATYLVESISLPLLRRVDGRGQRFYYAVTEDDIKLVPSVTSVIRATLPTPQHLVKWWCELGYDNAKRVLAEKAHYGTLMHILCAQLLQDNTFDLNRTGEYVAEYIAVEKITFDTSYWEYELKRDLLAFAQFCAEKEVTVIAIEASLMSERLGYAGTLDLVCELTFNRKRVRAIVDMKSGRKGLWEDYEIQLAAYRQLWNDVNRDWPVEMIFNWSPKDWRKDPTYELKNQTDSESAAKWPLLLELYKCNGEVTPAPIISTSGLIVLGKDVTGLYEHVDVIERLKRHHLGERAQVLKEAVDVESF